MNNLQCRRSGEHGQSIVELALVVPLLLVLVLAAIEFGFLISNQLTLTNAARDGARAGALPSGSQSQAVTAAQTSANDQLNSSQCSQPTPAASYSGSDPQQITVKVTCTYQPVTPLGSLVELIGGPFNMPTMLSGTAVMRVEQ